MPSLRKQSPAADALHVAVDDPRRRQLFPRGELIGLALLCVALLVVAYPGRTLLPLLARTRNDALAIDYLRELSALRSGDPALRAMLAERYLHVDHAREALAQLAGLQGARIDVLRLQAWEQIWDRAVAEHDLAGMGRARAVIQRLIADSRPADFEQWKVALELSRRFPGATEPPWLESSLVRLLPLDPARALQARALLLEAGRYGLAARVLFSAAVHARDPALRDRLILSGARVLLASGKPVRAWRLTERAVQHSEVGPSVCWMMLRLALGADRPAQAVQWLRRCVDLRQPAAVLARQMDASRRELAWRALLGSGLPAQALRVADAALAATPDDRRWQRRRAQVLEWSGHPDAALGQWMQLLRTHYSELALAQVHRLALGQHAGAALELYWRERAAHGPMRSEDWLAYAQTLESAGHARGAARVLRRASRSHPRLLPALAWLLGNMGEVRRSLEVYAEAARRGTLDLRASIDYANALVQDGRFPAALEVLASTSSLPGPSGLRGAHQRMLGDLAWDLGRHAQAEQAYAAVWGDGSMRAGLGGYQVERLILLTRRSRGVPAALALLRQAWDRAPSRDLAMLWLQMLQRRPSLRGLRQWQQRVRDSAVWAALSRRADMYAARAQVWQALGNGQRALADQQQALRLAPGDRGYEVGLLWICIDGADRACLRRHVPAFAPALEQSSEGLEVLLAAAQALGDTREALGYAQRLYPAHASDALWLLDYGDLWEQVGDARRAALAWDRAWTLLQRPPEATRGARAPADGGLRELIGRLRLSRRYLGASGQQSLLGVLRSRLRRGALTPQEIQRVNAAIADWLSGLDTRSAARWWLAHEALSVPARQSLQLQLDLGARDAPAIARDLRGGGAAALQAPDLAQAEQAAGQEGRSLRLAQAVLEQAARSGEDSPQLRALQAQTAARELALASTADLQWQDLRVDQVLRRGPRASLHWQADRHWGLDVEAAQQSLSSADGSALVGLPGAWRDASLGLRWRGAHRSLGLRWTSNRAVGLVQGWTLQASARLPWAIDSRIQLERNAVADESAALLVAGARDRLQLRLQRDFGRTWASFTAAGMRYRTRSGQALGSGRALQAQIGLRLRLGEPDVDLKLLGYQQDFSTVAGLRLPAYGGLDPGGAVPSASFFMPISDSAFGVGIGLGMDHAQGYAGRWMPYGELDLLQSRTLGLTRNVEAGVRGPLLGGDQLALGYQRVRDASGQSLQWTLQYRMWFGP